MEEQRVGEAFCTTSISHVILKADAIRAKGNAAVGASIHPL